MSEDQTRDTFEGRVILELMGHRRLAGYLREQQLAGAAFLRLDIPGDQPALIVDVAADEVTGTGVTQFYAPSAVYCITPTDEDTARAVAKLGRPAPVQRWELPVPSRSDDDAPEDYDG